ncbi:MAG TPA: protein kinase [Myxococcota bacterium]|nr:protein kinase [Myxococcota bacterium]HRY97062.1 protein kinase [Myxococcota bacterium]HSA20981.1 protein kinase [Myxococcota bacterium]
MEPVLENLGRYDVLEEVGRGGMAVVYRGRDTTLDRVVAVKVLHEHLAREADSRARFQREARAVARLRHPNIIEIYDFAEAGEGPSYIVTEFIEGQTLRAALEGSRAFFPEVAALVMAQICGAIAHAHQLGIIHRDLKPENIMITRDGTLKLMDFGIAKVLDQQQHMTLTGTILGSPAHMAPELLEGKELDARSDLFSLGTILYWLATGLLPFTGKNPHHVLRRILDGDFPDPQQANPEVGVELARVIRQALSTRPEDRHASADELRQALLSTLAGLGLDDVPTEVRRYFTQPAEFVAALRPRVEARLLERARERIAAGAPREALEALDRLLALRPGQPEALALLHRLEQRARRGRLLLLLGLGGLGAAALAALGWAALTFWPVSAGDADAGPGLDGGLAAVLPIPTGPGLPDAGAPGPTDAADGGGAEDAGALSASGADPAPPPADPAPRHGDKGGPWYALRPGDPRHKPPEPLPRPDVEHELTLTVQPRFDRLLLDGRAVAVSDVGNRYGQVFRERLKPGTYRVTIQNDFCQDDEFELTVPEALRTPEDLNLRRKLRFRPATLAVDSELPDAGVWVDGVFKGSAADSQTDAITIPLEGGRGTRALRLELRHPAAGVMVSEVTVQAGQRQLVRAPRAAFAPARKDGADGGGT